ncbi:hypothetical protein ACQ5SO_01605 [Rhodovulum sp. DZ06]|uniref:hypothetical protein n=1 Tax=Rhodovulum sp. DZ06 TaxID=3425126 RepID=UPI003D347347
MAERRAIQSRHARAVAVVAAGVVAANAVAGIGIALALQKDAGESVAAAAAGQGDAHALAAVFQSPHEAMAAGAMVFALSGFASALVMRLGARPGEERAGGEDAPPRRKQRVASAREDEPRQP